MLATLSTSVPRATSGPFSTLQLDKERALDAVVINVSGRQRMISQRISLLVMQLAMHPPVAEREVIYQKLQESLDYMLANHEALLYGDIEANLQAIPLLRFCPCILMRLPSSIASCAAMWNRCRGLWR